MIRDALSATIQCLHREGWISTIRKSIRFVGFKIQKHRIDRVCADVLFINGSYLKHPARYRVDHQIEQLQAQNITCSQVFYTELTTDMAKNYRLFVFVRCAYTDTIGRFIDTARKYNKEIIYDIDDLVFDRRFVEDIPYLNKLNDAEKKAYFESVDGCHRLLDMCDTAVVSTEGIATQIRKYVSEVYVNRNMISNEMAYLSEKAMLMVNKSDRNTVILGYFSGSKSHSGDLEMIVEPLTEIMYLFSNVVLLLVGEINVPDGLKAFRRRIRHRS